GLCAYLSRGLSVPVELFDPFEVVDASGLPPEDAQALEDFRLEGVTALGLAVMGSDPGAYSLEILPESVAKRREFLTSHLFLIAAGVLAVAYLGWYAMDRKGRIAENEKQVSRLSGELRRAKADDSRTRELLEENARIAGTVQELSWSVGLGRQAVLAMDFLAGGLPDDFWVTQMNATRTTDEELGMTRDGGDRPVVRIKGRTRDSAVSPAVQHRDMIARLESRLPAARINHTIDRTNFAIDLTFFAAPAAAPQDAPQKP
ncbi:MAG: hypothetical protein R3F17_14050, partial [Planctomycetota bacterium]